MMNGRNSGWGGGLPFVGGALGMLGLVGGLLYWALGGVTLLPGVMIPR